MPISSQPIKVYENKSKYLLLEEQGWWMRNQVYATIDRKKKSLAASGLRLYLFIEYIHQCLVLYFFFLMIPQIRSGN